MWMNSTVKVDLPCTVVIIRCSPRLLDEDNYIFSCKGIRDSIADLLCPGLAKGQADGSKEIVWYYIQEKSKKKYIRIKIEPLIKEPIVY